MAYPQWERDAWARRHGYLSGATIHDCSRLDRLYDLKGNPWPISCGYVADGVLGVEFADGRKLTELDLDCKPDALDR